jgi:hypothetical protein
MLRPDRKSKSGQFEAVPRWRLNEIGLKAPGGALNRPWRSPTVLPPEHRFAGRLQMTGRLCWLGP